MFRGIAEHSQKCAIEFGFFSTCSHGLHRSIYFEHMIGCLSTLHPGRAPHHRTSQLSQNVRPLVHITCQKSGHQLQSSSSSISVSKPTASACSSSSTSSSGHSSRHSSGSGSTAFAFALALPFAFALAFPEAAFSCFRFSAAMPGMASGRLADLYVGGYPSRKR